MGGCIILPKLSGVFCVIFQVFSLSSPFIWANEYLTRNIWILNIWILWIWIFYYQRFLRELPPESQLSCSGYPAVVFEHGSSRSWNGSPTTWGATLEHQAPCWVTAGYPGTTFLLLQEISKDSASLLMWNRTNRRWDEMLPGRFCFSELTSRSAWDNPLCCSCPWESWDAAEYGFITHRWGKSSMTFAEIQHVKWHFSPFFACIFTKLFFILTSWQWFPFWY